LADGEEAREHGTEQRSDEARPDGRAVRRMARGAALGLPAALGAVLLFALDRPLQLGIRWSIPLGLGACLWATIAVLVGLGSFADEPTATDNRQDTIPIGEIVGPFGACLLAAFAFVLAVAIAAAGALPTLSLPGLPPALRSATSLSTVFVPAAFLSLVSATFRLCRALGFLGVSAHDPDGETTPRPLSRRYGFWLLATGAVLFLPMAGGHSLIDPWETHYGEVSREVLARSDWISTWWAQDGFFWSKPVLNFWVQAIAMGAMGVGYGPDAMLAGAPTPWPEWAVRVPVVLFALVASYALYKAVAQAFGRRAGFFGGLVLMAMPQWAMLTHQTMADMPFVAAMSTAMALMLLGLRTDPHTEARTAFVALPSGRRFSLSAHQLVLGTVLLAALPQIFYLLSRNVAFTTHDGVSLHVQTDRFWAGSFGNCGRPGNEACTLRAPVYPAAPPFLQALGWLGALLVLLKIEARERRTARLLFLASFFFAALSTLGKGPAGLALPALCVLAYIAVKGEVRTLFSMEIAGGLLIVLAVAMPWYVAMVSRHGMPFVDRLFFHDMWQRALGHVHDTNEGDDTSFRYYVWQLGYALFPFATLLPVSVLAWVREPADGPAAGPHSSGRRDASLFLALWALLAFGLFSAMLTKFHHYIFPAVPPLAMLVGISLDRWMGKSPDQLPAGPPRATASLLGIGGPRSFGWLLAGVGTLVLGGSAFFAGGFLGTSPTPHPWLAAAGVLLGGALVLGTMRRIVRLSPATDEQTMTTAEAAFVVGAAALVCVVGRDLWSSPTTTGDTVGQARLIYLFTYLYQRTWPASLDFRGPLLAFSLVLGAALLAASAPRLRRAAIATLLAASLVFSFWVVNVYFVSVSPHWGQRELYERYYQQRTGPNEPIVAFQLNWKGENFYTGNHTAAFVSSGDKFRRWIASERERGVHTMYFVTEHRRLPILRSELGNPAGFELVTDEVVNNKFGLVRVRFD
jgi:4-amino-4-deoxy-L-arabinose transferase-like glycosyltransferase